MACRAAAVPRRLFLEMALFGKPLPASGMRFGARAGVFRRHLSEEVPKPAPGAVGGEGAAASGAAEKHVPMVVRAGRQVKAGGIILIWTAVGALVLSAGWFISRELLPTKMSPNSIFNRASDVLVGNPEVARRFGNNIKTYGEDLGGRREGRRFHIPQHAYEEDGVEFVRVRFMIEGERMKGIVFAEVASNKDDFNYLMVQCIPKGDTIVITDLRDPVKSREQRISEVAMALQTSRAVFYGNGPADATSRRQEAELGDAFQQIRYVRCDRNPEDCERDGVKDPPAWMIHGNLVQGVQNLEKLEALMKKKK